VLWIIEPLPVKPGDRIHTLGIETEARRRRAGDAQAGAERNNEEKDISCGGHRRFLSEI
jgi:hypothetical protein